MFVSKSLIESLIIDLALGGSFDREEAHELLYYLTTPGENVPGCMAEVLIEHPEVTEVPSQFPERLAFGVLDDALCRFDPEVRTQRQRKFFRSLNLVRLALQRNEFPDTAIRRSTEYHAVLLFASEAVQRLAEEDIIFPAEAPALLEQVLQAHLEIQAVTELLLEIQLRRFPGRIRSRLLERVQQGFEVGLSEQPAQEHSIVQLNQALGFRESLTQHERFEQSQHELRSLFQSLC